MIFNYDIGNSYLLLVYIHKFNNWVGVVCREMEPGKEPSLVQRYEACMVLGAVGDSLGYRGGRWEFDEVGRHIHMELADLGGLPQLTISP